MSLNITTFFLNPRERWVKADFTWRVEIVLHGRFFSACFLETLKRSKKECFVSTLWSVCWSVWLLVYHGPGDCLMLEDNGSWENLFFWWCGEYSSEPDNMADSRSFL